MRIHIFRTYCKNQHIDTTILCYISSFYYCQVFLSKVLIMTSKEWHICTGCFTLREMMILLRHIILSWSYLHRYRYFSKWVWNSTKYVYGKSHFRSTRKAQLCLNPLIAVLSSLDASVKQPFEIHINRQSLVCCAVV